MPFVIGMIDDSKAWPLRDIVRAAEISVSKTVPRVGIFDTKG